MSFDADTESKLAQLTPETERRMRMLLRYAERNGIPIEFVDYTYRTCKEQNSLYSAGITPARGCKSWHTWGRAADIYIPGWQKCNAQCRASYAFLADYWKGMGGKWGGDFSYADLVHFEWHPEYGSINDVCPSADALCPVPPWPEDRPWYARAALPLGIGLAAIGAGAAYYIWKGA
jgi:D-alanyl-D-alanine carboxypeptidase